jgi:hypothetical protein
MPRTKNVTEKARKQKLSPAERSQAAKDRWAKRRNSVVAQNDANIVVALPESSHPLDGLIANAIANAPEGVDRIDIVTTEGSVIASADVSQPQVTVAQLPAYAPQSPSAAPKKPKRYTGPKEFSVALKAAENRLAKAITERGETAGRLAALNAEIPSLLGIINALKGPQNYAPPAPYNASVPYDLSLGMPNAAVFQAPMPHFQPPINPMEMIQNASAALPVSRASGGAIQFSPEVLGSLEGPEDDDNPDKYITGPLAGGGWK